MECMHVQLTHSAVQQKLAHVDKNQCNYPSIKNTVLKIN